MGTIETRKLLKVGHSIVVCLPPGWLSWKGLKQGDRVRIRTNRKLTIEAVPMTKGTHEARDTKKKAN
jgi:antitoxin component of MazEF toxin-antitoxin module